ncbi:YadA C-terminal domain-containing protein [Kistimonas asteriae]|uniref:YadA C-terminal domain-containing protein n=1 Tax=Kistimonas asteriae TaxID=517724 RepID=UPI001BA4A9D8|nr:YadA C-terminal domain-containing protein [Kistimonas asteriae]
MDQATFQQMVHENREAINMQQVHLDSVYPDLRRVSLNNEILYLKPSWPEGAYTYVRDGQTYTVHARDVDLNLGAALKQYSSSSGENAAGQTALLSLNSMKSRIDRQSKAISVNAAFAALPSGYMPDKTFVAIGVGRFDGYNGTALGLSRHFDGGVVVQARYGVSGNTSVKSAAIGFGF